MYSKTSGNGICQIGKRKVIFSVCNVWGKALRPIAKPPTREEKERLSRERGKIKFANARFENRQVVRLRERG